MSDKLINNIGGPKTLPIPFYKNEKIVLKLEFRINNEVKIKTDDFHDMVEETVDRMQDRFNFEIYDENANSNKIVKNSKGVLCWKSNPGNGFDSYDEFVKALNSNGVEKYKKILDIQFMTGLFGRVL